MASPPFSINTTAPATTDSQNQFPAQEQTFRDTVNSWLNILSDHTTGKVKASALPSTISDNITFSGTATFSSAPVFSDQAGSRTALGLGTIATQAADNVDLSGGSINVGGAASQYNSLLTNRQAGTSFEFGHTNSAGYGSTLGADTATGNPFLAFSCGPGTTANTYKTFGKVGSLFKGDLGGGFGWYKVATANADNQSATTLMTLLSDGTLTLTKALAITSGGTGATDAATARSNLGLGSAATQNTTAFATAAQGAKADSAMQGSNNLSDVSSASTARSNLGLGTIATQAASAVAITGGSVDVGALSSQYAAKLSSRNSGGSIEFGHSNPGGYGSTVGADTGTGTPWIIFGGGPGTTTNTYKTLGKVASIFKGDLAGGFSWQNVASSNADNQSATTQMTLSNTGVLTAVGDVGYSSDRRLKTNIRALDGALASVLAVEAKKFDKLGRPNIGLIAQEVQEVAPEAVSENSDGFLTVNAGPLIGLLWGAVRELAAEVERLKEAAK